MDREAKIGIFLGIQWDIGKMDRETNWWIWALRLFLKFSVGILLDVQNLLNGAVLDPLILSESFYFYFFPIV